NRCLTGYEDRERVSDSGSEGVSAAEAYELAVGGADTLDRLAFAAEGDELWPAAQELDELGRQPCTGCGAPAAGLPVERAREGRHGDPAEEEPDGEQERRRREEGGCDAHADGPG